MNAADFVSPVRSDCAVCGRPLMNGWVLDYPKLAHEECIDWASRPFPYGWQRPVILGLARRFTGDASIALSRAGFALGVAMARWPVHALFYLSVTREQVRAARAAVVALGVDRRTIQRF